MTEPELNKYNYKKFSRKNLLPDEDLNVREKDERAFEHNGRILDRAKRMYDNLADFRMRAKRCVDYTFGRQLNDKIPNPDGCGCITEKEYLIRQGHTPMVSNIIRKNVNALVGTYAQSPTEPLAISRTREEQRAGEMMTDALKYEYQKNDIFLKNTLGFQDFVIAGLIGFRTTYGWDEKSKTNDLQLDVLDRNRLFFDRNTSGLYLENVRLIGYLWDMDLDDLMATFAETNHEMNIISLIYANGKDTDTGTRRDTFERDNDDYALDFYHPQDPTMCRVIEVWTNEMYRGYYWHDIAAGEQGIIPAEDRYIIDEENERRIQQILDLGGKAEDAATIEMRPQNDHVWVCRWLTPNGYVLKQEISPYSHGGHPFTVGAYPLIDGEIHSVVEDAINPQRSINRLLSRIEYARMVSAKGGIIIDKNSLDGLTLDEIGAAYARSNSVIALDLKEGRHAPILLNANTTSQGDVQMLQMYMQLMQDITGLHGALLGETSPSGTAASLYAQQAQNSNVNIAGLLAWYKGLILRRDTKIMQLIMQYFDDARYFNLVGDTLRSEPRLYDPNVVRNVHLDLVIVESAGNGTMRGQSEQTLLEMLRGGLIDVPLFLEMSSMPNADKFLERYLARQKDLQQQQMQAQAAMQGMQMTGGQNAGTPNYANPTEPASAEADRLREKAISRTPNVK